MKLKSLLLVICLCFFNVVFASNVSLHPKVSTADKKAIASNLMYPGYCQIEIINESYTDVDVFGTFDDGSTVNFSVYRFEAPHYIDLFYYFYCHSGMYLTIQSLHGVFYSGWINVDSTVHIVPYLKNAKALVTKR